MMADDVDITDLVERGRTEGDGPARAASHQAWLDSREAYVVEHEHAAEGMLAAVQRLVRAQAAQLEHESGADLRYPRTVARRSTFDAALARAQQAVRESNDDRLALMAMRAAEWWQVSGPLSHVESGLAPALREAERTRRQRAAERVAKAAEAEAAALREAQRQAERVESRQREDTSRQLVGHSFTLTIGKQRMRTEWAMDLPPMSHAEAIRTLSQGGCPPGVNLYQWRRSAFNGLEAEQFDRAHAGSTMARIEWASFVARRGGEPLSIICEGGTSARAGEAVEIRLFDRESRPTGTGRPCWSGVVSSVTAAGRDTTITVEASPIDVTVTEATAA